jgi:hypothetical protein
VDSGGKWMGGWVDTSIRKFAIHYSLSTTL